MPLKLIALLIFTFACSVQVAQTVKFKKNNVYIDTNVIYRYKKTPFNDEYYFYDTKTNSEVIYISLSDNGTDDDKKDDFTIIFFTAYNLKVVSKTIWFGLNSKPVIEKMVQEGVILPDGTINKDAMERFSAKYNNT